MAKKRVAKHFQNEQKHRSELIKYQEQRERDQELAEARLEERDRLHLIALDELYDTRNWREGRPLAHLAFHLAVHLRREAGIGPHKSSDMRRDRRAAKGPAIVRRYLWLRLWSTGKKESPAPASASP